MLLLKIVDDTKSYTIMKAFSSKELFFWRLTKNVGVQIDQVPLKI